MLVVHSALNLSTPIGATTATVLQAFSNACRLFRATPYVASKEKCSQIDKYNVLHVTFGYEVSQKKRKRVEECLGWMKIIRLVGKLPHREKERVD
jgi:hypothetical protein